MYDGVLMVLLMPVASNWPVAIGIFSFVPKEKQKGSVAEAPPVAGEARWRRLAKQAVRTAVSNAPIEPDGRGGPAIPPAPPLTPKIGCTLRVRK